MAYMAHLHFSVQLARVVDSFDSWIPLVTILLKDLRYFLVARAPGELIEAIC